MDHGSRMAFLSFLVYSDFWNKNAANQAKQVADDILEYKENLGIKEIEWGPAVHQISRWMTTDSLVVILKDTEESSYTLVIRGTNPISFFSWAAQDLSTGGLTPWQRQSPTSKAANAYISKATDTALAIHKNLVSNSQTVLQWLTETLNNEDHIHLNITGHSLGGLMSVVFTNYLADELTASGLINKVDFKVAAFAAPTPGNESYMHQLKEKLKNTIITYQNHFDIVTHVWIESDMENLLPVIYKDKDIFPNTYEEKALNFFKHQTRALGYEKLPGANIIKQHIIHERIFKGYLLQAGYQHVFPYLIWAYTPHWLKITERIIDILLKMIFHIPFAIPFFSNKHPFPFFFKNKLKQHVLASMKSKE